MKKTNAKLLSLFVLLIFISPILNAIPANPNPIAFNQPNGDHLTVLIKGDERLHWHESLDGYTLLYDQAGFLTYAQLDEDGNLVASNFIATDIEERDFRVLSFLHSIEPKLWFSDLQKEIMLQVWEIEDEVSAMHNSKGTSAVLGEYKVICALVQFPEKTIY
ncbi:MAG: hypothetical protein LBU83_06700 [Bacteroidales bacterium]|jgi:hypothetical protein|nr:hypothetical protein [Bacteroidales bacterium]